MKALYLAVSLVAVFISAGNTLAAQTAQDSDKAVEGNIPKTIADSVSSSLEYAEGEFLSIAEAMPEGKYSFIPTAGNFEGVRAVRLLQRI